LLPGRADSLDDRVELAHNKRCYEPGYCPGK
jgi:hypothetical protein